MHVLQLVPSLEVGGVERGVLDIAKGLIARGHRVSVVSSGGALVAPLTQLGAMHYRLPVHEKSLRTVATCIPAVTQLITATGVDLVHARSRVPGWIGYVAARRAQTPFLTTAHGFYAPHLASRVMTWGRYVIAPSDTLGRYLMEQLRLPRERLRVIPRGVDLTEFTFQPSPHAHEGPWRIGLFGRLTPIKGQEIALQALARLIRKGLLVRLCLAGASPGSPVGQRLESLIATWRLGDAVQWLGVRQDIATLIASVDLVVVPSTYPESFGRAVIEAQAVGRPVIASRLGALAELIRDGETGLLVPARDPDALAQAIERMIHDDTLRRRCVTNARAEVEARWDAHRMVEQTLAVYDECLSRPRILVWKLSALGDVILSTPSLRAIRRRYPQAHVTLAVRRGAHEPIARCPYLNELILYDPQRKDRGPLGRWAFVRRLRHGAFDVSIDFQNSRQTHLMAWLAGIPVRIGYRRKLGWLLNRGVKLPRVVLAPVAHQRYLLRQAGVAPDVDVDSNATRLELWPSAMEEEAAQRLFRAPLAPSWRGVVGIHPGGSGRWRTKRWELARWAELCDVLATERIQVIVVGGPKEHALGQALAHLTSPTPLILIGQTSVMELACLIKRCDVFVAHDSSTLHLAAAMGTPTVALFGPTDPARHLPPVFSGQVIKTDVFCSPCYSPRCRTITHACMKRITVQEVLEAVLGQLANAERNTVAS